MILDGLLRYSDKQVVAAGTVESDNVVKHQVGSFNTSQDLGSGEPMVVAVCLETASGAGVNVVNIETSADEAFSAPVVVGTATIPASQPAGSKVYVQVPPATPVLAYTRVQYVFADAATLSTYLQPQDMIDTYRQYNDNITIS